MATTQYIGARYVPLFAEPVDWNSATAYEALTIVYYAGNSYTSRQAVPKGIDITNTKYWALTGNYNAQVELYRQNVENYAKQVNSVTATLNDEIATIDSKLNDEIATRNDEIATIDSKLNDEIATIDSKLNDEIATIDSKLNDEIATIDSKLNDEIATIDSKLNGTTGSGLLTSSILNSNVFTSELVLTKKGTVTPPSGMILNSMTVDSLGYIYCLFSETGSATLIKYNASLTEIARIDVGDIHGNSMNYRASDNRIYMLGYSKVASINASTFSDLQVVETNLPIQSFVFSKDETLINGVIDGSNVVASYRVYDKYAYIIGYSKLNLPIGNNYAQDSCYVDGRHLIMYGYTYNQATPFMIASVDFYGNVKQTFMINKAFIDVTELEGIALYGETVLVGSSTGVIYSFSKSLIDVYSTNSNNYSFEPCYYIPNFKKAPNETVQTSSGNYILCRTPYKPLNVFAFRYQPMQFNVRGEHVFGAEGMYSASARFANVKIQYNYTNDTLWLRYINIQDIGNKTFEEGTSLDTYKTELDSLFSSNWGDVSIRGYGIFPFNTVLGCLIQLLP